MYTAAAAGAKRNCDYYSTDEVVTETLRHSVASYQRPCMYGTSCVFTSQATLRLELPLELATSGPFTLPS